MRQIQRSGGPPERSRPHCLATHGPPHEVAATYMGLMYGLVDLVTLRAKQHLQKGTRPAEYEELPPDYQDHYRVFGDVLDPMTAAFGWRSATASLTTWPSYAPYSLRVFGQLGSTGRMLESLNSGSNA
jgi:hypothetical protein